MNLPCAIAAIVFTVLLIVLAAAFLTWDNPEARQRGERK